MTNDELFTLWNKQVVPEIYKGAPGGTHSWEKVKTLPDAAEAYLRGKGASWPGGLCLYWPSKYPEAIVAELDGESGDLALRMLTAYDAMAGDALICHKKDDLKTPKALGKSLDGLFSQFAKLDDYRASPEAFGFGAAEYYPKEAKARVTSDLASACVPTKKGRDRTKKQNAAQALCYMALAFIKSDPQTYRSFAETIADYFAKVLYDKNENIQDSEELNYYEIHFIFSVLYNYYALSGRFLDMLKDCMLQGDIWYLVENKEGEAAKAFCDAIGVPAYVYPLMLASEDSLGRTGIQYLEKLFEENRPLFAETFKALLRYTHIKRSAPAFKLLNFMLKKAGENDKEALALKEEFTAAFPGLMKQYADELEKRNDRGRRSLQDSFLPDYLSLYEYLPFLADATDVTLKAQNENRKNRRVNNFAVMINAYFKGHAEAWIPAAGMLAADTLIGRGAVGTADIFSVYIDLSAYERRSIPSSLTAGLVKKYPADAAAFVKELSGAPAEGVIDWINAAFGEVASGGGGLDPKQLVPFLANKSKQVVRNAERLLKEKEDAVRESVEQLRPKLKGNGAMAARRLIKQWDTEKAFGKDFVFKGSEALKSFCALNFDDEAKKLVEWIPEDLYARVRYADLSGPSDKSVMGSLLSEYLFLDEPARIAICDKIAAGLNRGDLEEALRALYEFWLAEGADTKKKMVLIPCCVYGSDTFILSLKKQIEDWTKQSRGAIASFLVYCIAINGGSVALLMVDGYTNKAPNNQVKNTAREAFAFAARELGVTQDELSDRIVPDFGFDNRGKKTLDYGPRQFLLSIGNDFSLSIQDSVLGKEIKSLPSPSAKDDPVKAVDAKREFGELKKSIKAVAQNQTRRLERILMNGRKWNAGAWQDLFVKNPLMHRFALGLVWGVYSPESAGEVDRLLNCFRYMDDGSFNTADEEEYTLPEDARITLAHPIEMNDVETWKKQLEDYEIIQPLPQLEAPVLRLGEKDLEGNLVSRYKGKVIGAGKILGAVKRFDMKRGEVMDGGSYHTFSLEDDYLRIGAVLSFEYLYMGIDITEQIPLEYLAFYRMSEDGTSPFGWGEDVKSEDALHPDNVPSRYLSSMLAAFDKMVEEG
jgi:hypothetical protein